jgi:hypothetical protein
MQAATLGRLVAAVGVATAFLGIWLNAVDTPEFSVSYWDLDGSLAGVLLALAWLAGLACTGAVLVRNSAFDLMLGATGSVLLGLYLFFPAGAAFSQWDTLGRGAWLGVCSALIVIGAAVVLGKSAEEIVALGKIELIVAAVGWVLVMAGIWLDANVEGGSYLNPADTGQRGVGVLFGILLGLWALATLEAIQTREPTPFALAAAVAFMTFGLAFFIPASAAFDGLGDLRMGAWLPLAGAILLSVGSVLAIRLEAAAGAPR